MGYLFFFVCVCVGQKIIKITDVCGVWSVKYLKLRVHYSYYNNIIMLDILDSYTHTQHSTVPGIIALNYNTVCLAVLNEEK